jgi:hypothetical protein
MCSRCLRGLCVQGDGAWHCGERQKAFAQFANNPSIRATWRSITKKRFEKLDEQIFMNSSQLTAGAIAAKVENEFRRDAAWQSSGF